MVPAERWPSLAGSWVDAVHGDAIPLGMRGAFVMEGTRGVVVQGRPGSKTPFNLTFWAPRANRTNTADTVSGGCGFYPSGAAYCRGYGLSAGKSWPATIEFADGSYGKLRIVIGGPLIGEPWVTLVLKQKQ